MEFRNAKYIDETRIDCEIDHPVYGWIPFTCDPEDYNGQFDIADLHARMAKDELTRPYVPKTTEELFNIAAKEVRKRRDNILIAEVDPIVTNPLRWQDMSTTDQNAIIAYRKALLTIPDQAGFPYDVVWPKLS